MTGCCLLPCPSPHRPTVATSTKRPLSLMDNSTLQPPVLSLSLLSLCDPPPDRPIPTPNTHTHKQSYIELPPWGWTEKHTEVWEQWGGGDTFHINKQTKLGGRRGRCRKTMPVLPHAHTGTMQQEVALQWQEVPACFSTEQTIGGRLHPSLSLIQTLITAHGQQHKASRWWQS